MTQLIYLCRVHISRQVVVDGKRVVIIVQGHPIEGFM